MSASFCSNKTIEWIIYSRDNRSDKNQLSSCTQRAYKLLKNGRKEEGSEEREAGVERKEESFYDRDKYSAWKYIGQCGRASQEYQEPLQIRWFGKDSEINIFKQRSEWQEVNNRKIKGESNLIRFLYIQMLVKVTGRVALLLLIKMCTILQ